MLRGTIKKLILQKEIGFIEPDNGNDSVFFHISWLKGAPVKEGQRVEFEVERGDKGLRARKLRVLESAIHSNSQTETEDSSEYRFLNPYNFVSCMRKERPQDSIFGNCPPPPQDRYVGITGRIICIAETKTPLFISDSHETKENNGHKTYRFFQYGGQCALPASSLLGMVRSSFEAITNSCFLIFQKDEPYTLEHRRSRAPDMIPARVLQLDENGAKFELLDCTTNPPVSIRGGPSVIRTGSARSSYPPQVLSRRTNQAFDPSKSQLPDGSYDGMRVSALVTQMPVPHRSGWFCSFHVMQIVPAHQHSSLIESHQYVKIFGWLHLTGPNIENKHDERVFFRWDDRDLDPPSIGRIPPVYLCECDSATIAEYDHHLDEYWERLGKIVEDLGNHRWPNSTNGMPQPSTFVKKNSKLKVGDLVYVRVKGDSKCTATLLRTVSMPRIPYNFPRESFLFEHLKRCKNYGELCPACRMFGWVDDKPQDKARFNACASRVRFSHGKLISNKESLPDTLLAILSTPKPTTTPFYLLSPKGRPDPTVDYDTSGAQLRGRKFYRHQSRVIAEEYTGKEEIEQNRTVHGALNTGATFEFALDFKNLAPLELGALLYALELGGGMFHRLGYAKPLGFGSIKITITDLQTVDWSDRLTSLNPKAGWASADKNVLKNMFIEEMRNGYGIEYDNIIEDLRALLSMPPILPIHYPRITRVLDPSHPQFEWFMKNKRRGRDGTALELARNDKVGLTYSP